MASAPIVDLSTLDLDKLVVTREQIYELLPHRYEFMQLDGLVHFDMEQRVAVALRTVRSDEFWVRGHIPGRPLLPGVLMIESAAQLAAYSTMMVLPEPGKFWGFGGVEDVKFRMAVSPPAKMYFILKSTEVRPRRCTADVQGIVDGKLAFEGRVIGMPV
jgi:3-hydroxyacyl-[acyl-carrier-protein] dehydratase